MLGPWNPKSPYCIDCGSGAIAVHWGGGPRCQTCSDKFSALVQAKRRKKREDELASLKSHTYKRDLDGHCPDDGEVCEECCNHHDYDPDEGYACLQCGKEGMEDMICAAEAYWEGDR